MGSADLPVLLVHGPLIWNLALVACAAIAVGLVIAVRWIRARLRVAKAMRSFRGAERGRLRVVKSTDRVVVTTIEARRWIAGESPLAVNHRTASELWLDTADRAIRLDGSLAVIAGSRTIARRGRLPSLPAPVVDAARAAIPWLANDYGATSVATLAAGDEVVIRGVLEPHAGQAETGHREADIAWSMTGGDAPLELASCRPAASPLPLGIVRILVIAGLAAGAGRLVENALSDHYNDACDPRHESELATGPLELDNRHACVMLASLPNHRERGINRVLELLEEHPFRDPRSVAAYDTLAREYRTCDVRLGDMMNAMRYEAAIAEAQLCGDRRVEHEALSLLGRFVDAADLPVAGDAEHEALPTAATLIAAGRWTQAAEAVDRRPPRDYDDQGSLHYQHCFAEFLRSRGGDPTARARLVTLGKEETGETCTALIAELDPDYRRTWLAEHPQANAPGVQELLFAAGTEDYEPYGKPEQLLVHPEASVGAAMVWLPIDPATPKQRIQRLRWRAVAQVMAHDTAGAYESARAALLIAKRENLAIDGLDDLLPAIALHAGRTEPLTIPDGGIGRELWLYANARLLLRAGKPLTTAYVGPDHELGAALEAARDGNGAPLAHHLRSPHAWWSAGDVMAVWPHIMGTPATVELAAKVEWSPPYERVGIDPPPVLGAMQAFARRQTLSAVGARDAAAAWDVVFQRFDRVLRDRDRLVALMMWRD